MHPPTLISQRLTTYSALLPPHAVNGVGPDPSASLSNSYTNKVDVWSVGVLLYEMLLGRPPFQAVRI